MTTPLIYEFEADMMRGPKAKVATIKFAASIVQHTAPINDFDKWTVEDVWALGDLPLGGSIRCEIDALDPLYTLAMVTLCRRSQQDIIDGLWDDHTKARLEAVA